MKSFKKIVAGMLIAASLFTFAGCSDKISTDDEVTVENVNQDYKTIAHGYVQSIFTSDEVLFYACFPDSFQSDVEGQAQNVFETYLEDFDENIAYYGIEFSAENDYIKEDSYDEDSMRINISLVHHVDESAIGDIALVKERIYFTDNDNKYASMDLYMIVYQLAVTTSEIVDEDTAETTTSEPTMQWYFFEFADSDAEFY